MKKEDVERKLGMFDKGGTTYTGLGHAQAFFEEYVRNVETAETAFLWLTEEVGEAARIVRKEEVERYEDALGDIQMWLITLARLLDVELADALSHSVRQLVAKNFTTLPSAGFEIDVHSY